MRRIQALLGGAATAAALLLGGCGGECADEDGDGYCPEPELICSDTGVGIPYCHVPPADCDDTRASVHPLATEIPNDGIDQDCIGGDAVDLCDGLSDGDMDGLIGCDDLDCAGQCAAALVERCSGALAIEASSPAVVISGILAPGLDTARPSCFTGAGTEQVFRVMPGEAGQVGLLRLTLSSGSAVGFSVRGACDDASSEIACLAPWKGGDQSYVVDGGVPLDVLVDADLQQVNVSTGFTLTAEFRAAVCGDGVVVEPETCDDGGLVSLDGCSAACAFEPAFHCANVAPLEPGYLTGDTAAVGSNGFEGSCVGAKGPEQTFVFVPEADGTLAVAVDAYPAMGLHARSACDDPGSEIGCAAPGSGGVATLQLVVTKGVPVTVFVDSAVPEATGQFYLTTVFFPAAD